MENKLDHLVEFTRLLTDYRISAQAKTALQQTQLVLLVAPTSAGRNTVIKELLKTGHYHYLVSDTTRHPRVNNGLPEQNGREYWFRSEPEVLEEIRRGEFLEAAIIHEQQVSGISMRELKLALKEKKTAITDIEIVGAENIHRYKPDAITIFMLPPSFGEWIRRLQTRGAMTTGEMDRRLQSARRELSAALTKDYYFFVVNAELEDTAQQIKRIVDDPQPDPGRGQRGRAIAQQLFEDLNKELTTGVNFKL